MKKTAIIILATSLFFSCKKEKTCTTNTDSVAGSYKITAMKYKASASASEIDYINIIFPEACDRDNILTFQTNGIYQLKDVGLVCSPSGDENGTWSLTGNSMVINGDATDIESFDCATLVIVNADIQNAGDQLKITLTRQ